MDFLRTYIEDATRCHLFHEGVLKGASDSVYDLTLNSVVNKDSKDDNDAEEEEKEEKEAEDNEAEGDGEEEGDEEEGDEEEADNE